VNGPGAGGEPDIAGSVRGRASIIQNIGILAVAQAVAMLLNVVALIFIARTVGNYWFGVVQLGVAFSAYVLTIAEWGMFSLGVREVARLDEPAAIHRYAGTHIGLMISMGGVATLVALAVLPLFSFYAADPVIFRVYLAATLPLVLTLDWVGIGLERMTWVSVTRIMRSLIYALAVLVLLGAVDGLGGWSASRWVPVFYVAAYLAANVVMWTVVTRWLKGILRPRVGPWTEWRRRLTAASPIGASNLVLRVLLNVDVLLLGVLVDPAAVGDYAAAARVVFVLVVAVEVLWRALLPRLARLWRDDPVRFRQRFNLYLGLVLVGFLPLAAGGVVLGEPLMDLLYRGDYPGAGAVARILSVSYVLLAVGQFFGNALIACDRQREYFPPLLISALVAVGAVLLLATGGSITGAATGMLLSHATLLVTTGWVCRRLVARTLGRPLLVAAVGIAIMTGVLRALPAWPLVTLVLVGAAVYALVVIPPLWKWLVRERRR